MYMLTGKNEKEETVILDEKIPDSYAVNKTAEECGEFYPACHDFKLTKINEAKNV